MTLHETIDARATAQNIFDIVRHDLAPGEVVAQVTGRLGQVGHELIDVIVLRRPVHPAACNRRIEAAAELIGVPIGSRQELADLLVVDPGRRAR
jgi:hypothetical protein